MKYIPVVAFMLLFAIPLRATRVDTIRVYSKAMDKTIPVIYVLPDKVVEGQSRPVIYLLHGYGDNYTTWITKKPDLKEYVDEKGLIIVCPDGSTSWYWDSPQDPKFRYETFIAEELVAHTDRYYPTIRNRNGRAIAGQSMGGHGALWISIRHSDVFGAAGCLSGGVDIRPFSTNWEINRRLGSYETNPEIWDSHTVINQLDKFKTANLALTIDCGSSDFFYEVNVKLHQLLLNNEIRHDFIIRPGGHSWGYWTNAFDFQLLFFEKFFKN